MVNFSVVGSVKGHPIRWDRRSGAIEVKFVGLFANEWRRLPTRGFSTETVFDLVEAYLRRRR